MIFLKNFFKFEAPKEPHKFYIKEPELQIASKYSKNEKISNDLNKNIEIVKSFFHFPKSNDFKMRNFKINIDSKEYNAIILFYDGLVDSNSINSCILKPLMKNIVIENKSVLKNTDIEKFKNAILR